VPPTGGAEAPGVRPYIPTPNFLGIMSKLLRYPENRVTCEILTTGLHTHKLGMFS